MLRFSADALKTLREERGLSRTQLAALADVTYFNIVGWEKDGQTPRADRFVLLVDALQCDPHDLMTDNEVP